MRDLILIQFNFLVSCLPGPRLKQNFPLNLNLDPIMSAVIGLYVFPMLSFHREIEPTVDPKRVVHFDPVAAKRCLIDFEFPDKIRSPQ